MRTTNMKLICLLVIEKIPQKHSAAASGLVMDCTSRFTETFLIDLSNANNQSTQMTEFISLAYSFIS